MSDTQSIPLSVIIPVYNDPEGLETTVESLLDQTVDDYEILVADNGSTDLTRKLAKAYATRDRVIHVVEDEIQGSYAARNAGIAAARGEILCFIDADMWVDSTWLERVQERIRSDEADYLGCNVEIVVDEETIFAEYNRENGFPVETYIAEENFAPTCCLVVRRSVIDAVGPFDKRLVSSGDAEFGKRVHRAGYEQAFAGDITMYHPARSSLLSLLQKQSRIGRDRSSARPITPSHLRSSATRFTRSIFSPSLRPCSPNCARTGCSTGARSCMASRVWRSTPRRSARRRSGCVRSGLARERRCASPAGQSHSYLNRSSNCP